MSSDRDTAPPEIVSLAKRILSIIEGSGWGTADPNRYTPTFHVESVKALAEWIVTSHGQDRRPVRRRGDTT